MDPRGGEGIRPSGNSRRPDIPTPPRSGRRLMPQSSCWGDGDNLAAGNREVVGAARVAGLGRSWIERSGWVVGPQLHDPPHKPGSPAALDRPLPQL